MSVDVLEGFVEKVIFNQGDYYILAFGSGPDRKVKSSVKGEVFGLRGLYNDIPIRFIGSWSKHKRYGNQFSVERWEPFTDNLELLVVFLTNCVEGFTPATANFLVNTFGPDVCRVLYQEPDRVLDISSTEIHPEQLAAAVSGWRAAVVKQEIACSLKNQRFTSLEIQAIFSKYGMGSLDLIKENPYRLMSIPSMSFAKVDRLALRAGLEMSDLRRLQGVVLWTLQQATKSGHLFLRRGQIAEYSQKVFDSNHIFLGNVSGEDLSKAVQSLIDLGELILDLNAGVYLPFLYEFERDSANIVVEMSRPANVRVDLDDFLSSYESSNSIHLSDSQKQAVEALNQNNLLVLTGLPGTGKTTVVRALVRLFEEARLSVCLMAPTGIAAKRLSFVTSRSAYTVHRALRYDGTAWGFNSECKFAVDAVIVDEMSMVDQELFYRLVMALRPETILVLVGDSAQLPSVGPGNVLRELVGCKTIPHVELTQIFRQSESSGIVTNSHLICRGETPYLGSAKEDEFKFIRLSEESKIASLIADIAEKFKAKDANFQVISPKYAGAVGVDSLNTILRDRLNPGGFEVWSGNDNTLCSGDRVMVVQNDYKKGIYNGDVGKIICATKGSVLVRIHGIGPNEHDTEVEIPMGEVSEKLKLAYAVTVHKCQGSEFDNIVMPIVRSHGRMLQRNLLYTAVTRAKSKVWLIGDEIALKSAIDNSKVSLRNTVLGKCIAAGVSVGDDPGTC